MSFKRSLTRESSRSRKRNASTLGPSSPYLANSGDYESVGVEHGTTQDFEEFSEVIMAVDSRERGTVGCSYFVASEENLFLMEDAKLSSDETLDTLKTYIEPTTVLIPTRVDEAVEQHFAAPRTGQDSDDHDGQFAQPFVIEHRPMSEFRFDTAKQKLLNLNLGSELQSTLHFRGAGEEPFADENDQHDTDGQGSEARRLNISGRINFGSRITIGCAGAVIAYLQRKRTARFLPGDEDANLAFRITNIETFSLEDTMLINSDTLLSLQILESQAHPHAHNQGPSKTSGSKEGLSIYGLFYRFASTPQGVNRLRQIFLRPSTDVTIINERLDAVGIFSQTDNVSAVDSLVKSLKKVKNMKSIMIQLRKGIMMNPSSGKGPSRSVWTNIQNFAYHVIKILEYLAEVNGAQRNKVCRDIFSTFDTRIFETVGAAISLTVDFEASEEQHRTVIKAGIDTELDDMKQKYDGMDSLLSEVAQDVAQDIEDDVSQLNAIYYPQIGFLLSVPVEPETSRGVIERSGPDDPWSFMFVSEAKAYYKSKKMVELDHYFGDIHSEICDREIVISLELAQDILKYEDALGQCSDLCGELDSILALCRGVSAHKLVRPRVTEDNVIDIKGCRHLLQELAVPSFVANDAFLQGGEGDDERESTLPENSRDESARAADLSPNLLLLTGPNFSGKTVYLKQIALAVYMAHIGSFVPALSAKIGITDKILSRISTRETVSKMQSAFMIDLQQIVFAISHATRRSLVIIDEFGKGTNAHDGAGLACGVFEHFLGLGCQRPKVLAATHFHEIFENGHLTDRSEVSFGHMEVMIDSEKTSVEEQLSLRSQLRKFWGCVRKFIICVGGQAKPRHAYRCAEMNGIDSAIIARANELALLIFQGEDLEAACSKLNEQDIQVLKKAETVTRNFLRQTLADTPETNESISGILDEILEA